MLQKKKKRFNRKLEADNDEKKKNVKITVKFGKKVCLYTGIKAGKNWNLFGAILHKNIMSSHASVFC